MGKRGAFNVDVKALHCFDANHKLLYILFERFVRVYMGGLGWGGQVARSNGNCTCHTLTAQLDMCRWILKYMD